MSSPSKVRAAHLLIKHTSSRNPVSRRTGQTVTLSPEDAASELRTYEAKLRQDFSAAAFMEAALQRSDCSSFARNGDLGEFGAGQMQEPFEKAAFALGVGEMSTICSTDSGYHLIYRIS